MFFVVHVLICYLNTTGVNYGCYTFNCFVVNGEKFISKNLSSSITQARSLVYTYHKK